MVATPEMTEILAGYDEELVEYVESEIATDDWTEEDLKNFIDDLEDIGIDTAEGLERAYYMQMETSHNVEAEFAEEWYDGKHGIPDNLAFAIDWQRYWDHLLTYDYNYIEFRGSVYFFSNY